MNETHRTVKRLLSTFLCIVMILALAPMTVFALDEEPVEPPRGIDRPVTCPRPGNGIYRPCNHTGQFRV